MEKEITKQVKWKSSDVEPSDWNAPVLYCTANGKLGVFKNTVSYVNGDVTKQHSNWKWYAEKYNIRYWVYANEIIP